MKKDFSEIMNKDTTTIGGSVNHDIVGVGVSYGSSNECMKGSCYDTSDTGFKEKSRTGTIERMGRDDRKCSTRLLDKQYSPLIVRKYQVQGWPMFIGLIVDVSLSDLDMLVHSILKECEDENMFQEDIQAMRNITGYLNDKITKHYNSIKQGCVEGVAVLYFCDKCSIASLGGDFMTHLSCKKEFYSIIQTLPHV